VTKAVVTCTWDDVPHLSEDQKSQLLEDLPSHVRETRSLGVPSLGAGAVYPIPENRFVIDPIPIAPHWRRVFGFDGGYHHTSAIWGALDKDSDILYLYTEHQPDNSGGEWDYLRHASSIKMRGDWIPGVGDAAATSQLDGKKTLKAYRDEGIDLKLADKSVDAGIQEVTKRISQGRLKVFSTCTSWLKEYRIYRYDDNGKIVKKDDHLMDCTRYLCMSGIKRAKSEIESYRENSAVVPERLFGNYK